MGKVENAVRSKRNPQVSQKKPEKSVSKKSEKSVLKKHDKSADSKPKPLDCQIVLKSSSPGRHAQSPRLDEALVAACGKGQRMSIEKLLDFGARPCFRCFETLWVNNLPHRASIASRMAARSEPGVILRAFWLACIFNDVECASMFLKNCKVDPHVEIFPEIFEAHKNLWPFGVRPLPIQVAAYHGYEALVQLLENFMDEDRLESDYVNHRLVGAFRGREPAWAELPDLGTRTTVQIYDILGAVEIIKANTAVGKNYWKKGLTLLQINGRLRERGESSVTIAEPGFFEFRTVEDVDAMRAKELRLQAIHVLRRHFGASFLFVEALVSRSYSHRISVMTLEVLRATDNVTERNLRLVEHNFEAQRFFQFPEIALELRCLQWCIDEVRHLRELLDERPEWPGYRRTLQALIDFTARIVCAAENLEEAHGCANADLNHLLRRTIAVFQPVSNLVERSIIDQLNVLVGSERNERNIFDVLRQVNAELDPTGASCTLKFVPIQSWSCET